MVIGLGIDLIEISRIERAIERHPRFLERFYTEAEREAVARKGMQTAAGYFAAKEAVSKALGTGFLHFTMADISIEPDALGRPVARLTGGALARMEAMGGKSLFVSVTHDAGFAMAAAVLEG
ncbi:MAG: holo-ACP synthase [Clostridia bacterium]|nr:holo-ACP synthase [Clostridia bacterium]